MAFAPPDPKRLEADRQRLRQRELDDIKAIEDERKRKREIRACYHEHSPAQIANAGAMIRNNGDGARKLLDAATSTDTCWERIGRSNGGRTRRNLYRCTVQ